MGPEVTLPADCNEASFLEGTLLRLSDQVARRLRSEGYVGRTVAVKLGTTGELYARDHLPRAALTVLKEESACVLEVIQGKADAFLYDQMSIYQHWNRHHDTTQPLLAPFKKESGAIGLRKGRDDLREQVNGFLSDFRARGGFDELADRHLREMREAFLELGQPSGL